MIKIISIIIISSFLTIIFWYKWNIIEYKFNLFFISLYYYRFYKIINLFLKYFKIICWYFVYIKILQKRKDKKN